MNSFSILIFYHRKQLIDYAKNLFGIDATILIKKCAYRYMGYLSVKNF